MLFYTILKL